MPLPVRSSRLARTAGAACGGLLFLFAGLSACGCSDVGDTTAVPSGADATEDSFEPDAATGTDANEETSARDSTMPDAGSPDATVGETPETGSTPEAALPETGTEETSAPPPESGVPETGVEETGAPEASVETGAPESGTEETGAPESGSPDTGSPDTGSPDAASHDAEADGASADTGADTGSADAESDSAVPDGSADASHDTGTPDAEAGSSTPTPCTTAGQTNCVQCWGNNDNLCTATEAILVQLDIDKGLVDNSGSTATGCYSCMVNADCSNDDVSGDSDHECGDLTGNFAGDGGGAGQSDTSLCLATLTCLVTTGCASATDNEDACYCGAGGGSPSACASAGAATNGACKTQITNGLYPSPNDSTDVLKDFTDTTEPSGMADQLLHCAIVSKCTQCLQ